MISTELSILARKVVSENIAAGRTVAIAESCTGGMVCAAITDVAGSSAMFKYGFVTYGNVAKTDLLKVNNELIETFGAVSIAVAWAMAQGALEKSGADVAVAITGVAGPDGGSEQKPIGTVVFAVAQKGADPENMLADREYFGAGLTRAQVREAATLHALKLLLPPLS